MLNLGFGNLAFVNPWILAGLLALPLLWFLLRVFPPVPRMIHLPGTWLLEGLVPDRQTTSKTPWWILLLRTGVEQVHRFGHKAVRPAHDAGNETRPRV